jgi:hypothetical protein
MNEQLEQFAAFIMRNKIKAIAIFAGVWIFAIIISAVIALSGNGGEESEAQRLADKRRNDELREQAQTDERLLTRGIVLSTRDNTPVGKIRLYSKLHQKSVQLNEDIFNDVGLQTPDAKPAQPRESRTTIIPRTRERAPAAAPQANKESGDSRMRLREPSRRFYDTLPQARETQTNDDVPGMERSQFSDTGDADSETVLP